jgi:uncharacterized surface protein with fasciclin (FAS1) repeats
MAPFIQPKKWTSFPSAVWTSILTLFLALPTSAAQSDNLLEVTNGISYFALLNLLLEITVTGAGQESGITARTIFGPVDAAFQQIDEELLTYLITEDQWNLHLRNLLGCHMLNEELYSAEIKDGSYAENMVDELISFSRDPNGAGPITVNGIATIVESDILTTNGVIHAIDTLIGPRWLNMNIISVLGAAENSHFSTFLGLGDLVGGTITDMLSTFSQPYTVFAPTNEAFDSMSIDFVNNVDIQSLAEVLKLHLVPGIYTENDLLQMSELESLAGQKLTLSIDPAFRSLSVNGQPILETNILANNGVIHVINGGLLIADQEVLTPYADPHELEHCTLLKALEEFRGAEFGVQCNCDVSGSTVALSCSEVGIGICSPRYGQCDMVDQFCCTPMRRCVAGQCRDSSSPERVKLSGAHGGAAARTAGNSISREKAFP